MKPHWPALLAVTAVVLVAAVVSPGHALLLALGLALGPLLNRYLAERGVGQASAANGALPLSEANPLQAVLDAVANPVMVVDMRANLYHANPAARAAYTGLVSGQPLSFSLRAPQVLDALSACLADGIARTVELVERVPVERAYACTISPLTSRARPPAPAAVIVLREISKERAIEAMRVDFVANASHELRTPLASVLGFIETLQGPARNDPAAREKFLGIMHTQARRMARLVDDLLSLSRIELKEHIAPTDTVDMARVVDDIALSLSEIARERGVEISILRETDQTLVLGDRDELASVMDNLIENAIKYGRAGQRVDVTLSRLSNSDVSVSVRDYGPGIEPEFLPRLTERFYRVDSQLSRAEGGTGLGLALVKHTINRHRGRLEISSVPGQGASFTVILRAALAGTGRVS